MKSLGIDIGSRTIKTVLLSENGIEQWEVVDATSRPSEIARKMLAKHNNIPVMTTGYGRHLLETEGIPSITEIKACARGVRHLRSGGGGRWCDHGLPGRRQHTRRGHEGARSHERSRRPSVRSRPQRGPGDARRLPPQELRGVLRVP